MDPPATNSGTAETTFQAEVTEQYQAEDDGQISINPGEIVTVYGNGDDQNGWFYGYKQDGTAGYFPSTYVTVIQANVSSENVPDVGLADGADLQPYGAHDDNLMGSQMPSADGLDRKQTLDPSTGINLMTLLLEWATVVMLFLSGCFCIAYGKSASVGLGVMQLLITPLMGGFLYMMRDDFHTSPALARAGIWFVVSLFVWTAPPVGVIAGGACTICVAMNILTFVRNSPTAMVPNVFELVSNDVATWSNVAFAMILFWFLLSIGFWVAGKNGGKSFREKVLKDEQLAISSKYDVSSGFSTVISINIMFYLLLCCQGLISLLVNAIGGSIGGMISDIFVDRKDGIHRSLAIAILIASFGHTCAIFGAYKETPDSYGAHFGAAPFATAAFIVWGMTIMYTMFHPNLSADRQSPLFRIAYDVMGPIVLIFLLLHGKHAWNSNFWKYMIVPGIFYSLDYAVKSGYMGQMGGGQGGEMEHQRMEG